jgi:hypothetical protein
VSGPERPGSLTMRCSCRGRLSAAAAAPYTYLRGQRAGCRAAPSQLTARSLARLPSPPCLGKLAPRDYSVITFLEEGDE